jgi:hypothetical protein
MSDSEDKFLEKVRKKFKEASDCEESNRLLWLQDMRFTHLPGHQWPEEIRRDREMPPSPRPCVEINVTAQHVYQVVNDIRQNRPTIKVRPVSMNASTDVAEVFDGVIRHIDACSSGDIATDVGVNHQVTGGWGYIRLTTDYTNKEDNEQGIYVKPVHNPLSIYLDANAMCPVGSDAVCAFVVDEIPKDEFESRYGEEAGKWADESAGSSDWVTRKTVRVAEYFEKVTTTKNVMTLINNQKITETEYWTQYSAEQGYDHTTRPGAIAYAEEEETKVKWWKLTSGKILEGGIEGMDFPSKYIPIIRVPGLIVDIDGQRYFKGLVRDAVDPQRVFNYQWSTFIEAVALQPKVPWLVADGQIEDNEADWNRAHTANLPYLKYKTRDAEGNPVGPPQRSQLAMAPQGVMEGLQLANDAIKMVTGQYEASLGQRSNETSGKAIIARQREGDTATYHFIDGLSMAIAHKGRILIDMIPRVFDKAQIIQILGEDNSTDVARIDPSQPQAVRETTLLSGTVEKIYNLNVGRYDVLATVGPSYTTKRQEAVEAMVQIMQGNPQFLQLAGDIFFRANDWPGADQIADRWKAMLPPQIQQLEKGDQAIPPELQAQMQQMQAQMQQMGQALQQAQMEAQKLQMEKVSKAADIQMKQIDLQIKQMELQATQIDAQTKRMEVQAKIEESHAENIRSMATVAQPQASELGAIG